MPRSQGKWLEGSTSKSHRSSCDPTTSGGAHEDLHLLLWGGAHFFLTVNILENAPKSCTRHYEIWIIQTALCVQPPLLQTVSMVACMTGWTARSPLRWHRCTSCSAGPGISHSPSRSTGVRRPPQSRCRSAWRHTEGWHRWSGQGTNSCPTPSRMGLWGHSQIK